MNTTAKTAPLDHLPDDFDLEELKKTLTDQEIAVLSTGDDPIFADPVPEPQPVPEAQPAPASAQPAPVMPVLPEVPDTTAAKATVDAFETKEAEIITRYENGELDTAELRAAMRALTTEQAAAQAAIQQAAVLEKVRADTQAALQKTIDQQWTDALDAYKAKNPVLWEDQHVGGWDSALRSVTHDHLGIDMNMEQCIAKAHEVYRMNYTATTGKVLGGVAVPAKEDHSDGIPKEPRTDPRDPPPTLGDMNGQLTHDAVSSKFAAIDRMREQDPLMAEKMYAALTPIEEEAYLRGAGLS